MANLGSDELKRRLNRALKVAGHTHTPQDVAHAVSEGRMQAWVNGESLVVTEVLEFPRAKALNVFLAVGDLNEVMSMQPSIEEYGRQNGCVAMRMEGRRGWSRVLPQYGWKQDTKVIYERAL